MPLLSKPLQPFFSSNASPSQLLSLLSLFSRIRQGVFTMGADSSETESPVKSMETTNSKMKTTIIPTNASNIGQIITSGDKSTVLDDWDIQWTPNSPDVQNLRQAASQILHTDIPIAFPTETVYGLGADATRSAAVRGIFSAKNRPPDNPLIVHIHSLNQLRSLLPNPSPSSSSSADPIPAIYAPLIQKFWPGPLTILLPLPADSQLAPEVSAGQPTFGARMPRSLLALALLKLAAVPMAAPSANASTKPSPTTAEHVLEDLDGRIATIIDGGPCDVGVESTVVDGLSTPPAVLRPGGVPIEAIRGCKGWEGCVVGYGDAAGGGLGKGEGPRAPGMKYRHYSPRAGVLLFESGRGLPSGEEVVRLLGEGEGKGRRLGVMRTGRWGSLREGDERVKSNGLQNGVGNGEVHSETPVQHQQPPPSSSQTLQNLLSTVPTRAELEITSFPLPADPSIEILEVELGHTPEAIARSLFSALRLLDRKGVDKILLEGIDDAQGELAAAIMNRVRKAAEVVGI